QLLEEGSRTREELRKRVWAGLYRKVKVLVPGDPEVLEGVPGLRQAWEAAREGDPETAIPLLNWANGVNFRDNPWRGLKGTFPFLEGLRELLVQENGLLGDRPADGLLWKVWPQLGKLVKGVLRRLEEHRSRARRLGYADLEVHALRALERAEVREHYRERFRHLLVDEFQDTNPVQYRLLRALFPHLRAWSVVGDPNQSIYGFRRADPRVMGGLREEAEEKMQILSLDTTHRYHEGLARFHNAFFGKRLPYYTPVKAARQEPREGASVFFFQGSLEEQARLIAQEVVRLKEEGFRVWDRSLGDYRPLEYRDVAVLGRKWAHLAQAAETLQELGVPAVEARGGNLLE
ncbi:MAG: UvrD-helicase domain-containing protein, partial [Burkholderiales bacterium]|nr:UvrD-helicase domain-containing protein [Burkholderiales bacterium]